MIDLGLTGKRAIVSGAGYIPGRAGHGRHSSLRLAEAGATVACIDIDEGRGKGIVDEMVENKLGMLLHYRKYGVTFPITAKAEVKGPSAHPFYKWAAVEQPGETPRWNFHKYLIGRDGHIAAVFPSAVEPTDTRLITAIAKELGSGG